MTFDSKNHDTAALGHWSSLASKHSPKGIHRCDAIWLHALLNADSIVAHMRLAQHFVVFNELPFYKSADVHVLMKSESSKPSASGHLRKSHENTMEFEDEKHANQRELREQIGKACGRSRPSMRGLSTSMF